MKKLTSAQEKVLAKAKQEIDEARACATYEEWAYNTKTYYKARGLTFEEALPEIRKNDPHGFYHSIYNDYKEGKALVMANTKTLHKLEEMGLIKIIEEGGRYPDTIEIIGY